MRLRPDFGPFSRKTIHRRVGHFHFKLQQISGKLLLALILGSTSKSRVFERKNPLASFQLVHPLLIQASSRFGRAIVLSICIHIGDR